MWKMSVAKLCPLETTRTFRRLLRESFLDRSRGLSCPAAECRNDLRRKHQSA